MMSTGPVEATMTTYDMVNIASDMWTKFNADTQNYSRRGTLRAQLLKRSRSFTLVEEKTVDLEDGEGVNLEDDEETKEAKASMKKARVHIKPAKELTTKDAANVGADSRMLVATRRKLMREANIVSNNDRKIMRLGDILERSEKGMLTELRQILVKGNTDLLNVGKTDKEIEALEKLNDPTSMSVA